MKKNYALLLLMILNLGFGQNQTIFKDNGFQSPKLAYTNYQTANGQGGSAIAIKNIKRLSDGKLLVYGLFTNFNGDPVTSLVRLNSDGSLDKIFEFPDEDFKPLTIQNVLIQTDGKILVLANQQYSTLLKIIRLLPNGVRDTTYNTSTFEQFSQVSCDIQTDNKLVIGISSNPQINNVACNSLIRLNTDGTLDNSFNSPLVFCSNLTSYSDIQDVKIDSSGKIIVVGSDLYFSSCSVKHIIRLNTNGTEDSTFVPSTAVVTGDGNYLRKICLLTDNKIMIAGTFPGLTGDANATNIIKLNTDGTLDSSYTYGSGIDMYGVQNMQAQPDNKLVVLVRTNSLFNGMTVKEAFRINTDGSLDSTFDLGPNFIATGGHTFNEALCIEPNGNILLGGNYTTSASNQINGLIEVNSSGFINSNFSIGTGFKGNGFVNEIQQLADGKILIGGAFDSVNGLTRRGLARLNTDGSLDATFDTGGVGFDINANIRKFAVQTDGKIVAAGVFSNYDGVLNTGIIRLNFDGTLDTTFATCTTLNDTYLAGYVNPFITSVVIQNDGKIIITGDFTLFNTTAKKNILRLNADGTLDTSFITGVGFNAQVSQLQLQSDQKMLVSGNFTKYNNVTVTSRLLRLNTNGTLDSSFNPIGYLNGSRKFTILPDGKILAIRTGVSIAAFEDDKLQKLNSDGTLDQAFLLNMEYTSVSDFCVQPDNKIIMACSSLYNSLKKITRINDDGTLDTGFDIGSGISKNSSEDLGYGFNYNTGGMYEVEGATAKSLFLQNDGKILVGGYYTNFDGQLALGTVRLLNATSYSLKGQHKLDHNNDGCDATDLPFPNLKFHVASLDNNFDYVGNLSGNYNIGVVGGSYTITPIFENPSYFTASPASVTVNFPTQVSPQFQNFCITPNGVHSDLEITLLPLNIARPGFDVNYKLVYKNKGNQTQSGTINVIFNDAVLDVVSANPVVSSQSLNNLNWNFTNLNPFETREILVALNLNSPTETPSVTNGFILNYTASISSVLTDELPLDNTFVLNQTVVNSLDPNDKTCLEGANIAVAKVGEYVHYVIRFENTGNYKAQNIAVRDAIDISKYDINTLVPTNGSHSFVTKISDGNKVEFYFENINLDYNDGSNSPFTGYVAFKIKTKSTLVAGDSFSNTAGIYFDYNEAVITNTATTLVQPNLGMVDVVSNDNSIILFPNPVRNSLNVNAKSDVEFLSISIYNTLGQLILVIPNAKKMESIDVSSLKTGNYFVKINSDKGILTNKFIKI